jgi:hypothetical protein
MQHPLVVSCNGSCALSHPVVSPPKPAHPPTPPSFDEDEAELQAAEAEVMGDLDAATQRKIAAGYRDFADCFK